MSVRGIAFRLAIASLALSPALTLAGDTASTGAAYDPHSRAAFEAWLADPSRKQPANVREFREFRSFLAERGVADVVPAWQLLRTDAQYAARCDLPAFAMPPRSQWAAIVPVLRLVRERVKPTVGEVEVYAAWRSPELNNCVKGASASRHLAFAAIDLVTTEKHGRLALFEKLCALHARQAGRSPMGLGAYFDPKEPARNRQGRFHIDASGYRSWGFDFTAKSSACRSVGNAGLSRP